MKTYTIYLIRHGQTAENQTGKYIGSTDVPLSKEGIEAIKEYDKKYIYPGTPVIFSSPMLRSVQTCNIIYPALKPVIIPDFRECSFGDWENKSADELKGDPSFANWLADSQNNTPPNGESGADFIRRVCLSFEKVVNGLIRTGNTTCVIVTHGGVISTILSVYGLPHAKPYEWACDNGFGYAMRISPMLWMRDKVAEVFDKIPRMN